MGRPVLSALRACLLAALGTVAAGQLSAYAAGSGGPLAGLGVALREPLNFLIVVAIGWLFARAYGAPVAITTGRVAPALGWGLAGGLVPVGLAWILALASGPASGSWSLSPVLAAMSLVSLPFLVLHGLAEQWLIRRLAQDRVEAWLGPIAGIMGAALVWTAVQAFQGYGTPMQLANSFLFAVLLGQLARGTGGGVLAAGLAHGLWTWTETQLIPSQASLILPAGWLGGAAADTYGAGAFSLALIALIAFAAWRFPPRAVTSNAASAG